MLTDQVARRTASFGLLAALALAACHAGAPAAAPLDSGLHPDWSRNAVIYEVNIRQYTPEGTFAAFERHLPRLQNLGVDILWIMPVQPIGRTNRKGTLGSYYSVADYHAINPEFGTQADFKALVDSAHALGMKVILDWVANHTAFDNPWTTEHPDFYHHRPDGSISVALDNEGKETDWTDVADLNYDNQELREAMIGEMRWWLDTFGIDGFRCDVAGFVPYDFWAQMRQALAPSHPGLFLLAEWEDPRLHATFDMTYGWELYHLLNQIARDEASTAALDAYFGRQDSTYPADAYRTYFTSNHDENSWNGSEFERMGANHQPAFVLSATVQNSLPLIYTGQEASLQKRLRFFDKDTVAWSDTTLTGFYRSLIRLKHTQTALRNGAWGGPQTRLHTAGGGHSYAFTRTRAGNTVLVAVNFGADAATVRYLDLTTPGTYTDWFDLETLTLPTTGSLEIPAHGFRVLVRN